MAKKKHRVRKFIRFIFILLLIIILLPVGVYFGLIRDTKFKNVTFDDKYTSNSLINDVVGNCLNNTKTTKMITFDITDQQMSNVLNSSISSALNVPDLDSQVFAEFKDGYYYFYFQIKYNVPFENGTTVMIKTELVEENRADMNNEDCFVFKFKDLKIGKIGGLTDIAVTVLKNFISEEDIQKEISKVLSIKVNLAEKSFIYKKSDFFNDIKKTLGNAGGSGFPLTSFLETLITNNLIHINPQANHAIEFNIDCNDMTNNAEYVASYDLDLNNASKHGGLTLDSINEKLAIVLNNNENIKNKESVVFKFLFNGYNKLSESDKRVVDDFDLSCLGATFNKTEYVGFDLKGQNMNEVAAAQIDTLTKKDLTYFTNPSGFDFISLDEEVINTYMSSTGVLAYNYILSAEDANGDLKTSYIAVDNLYCNVYNNKTNFVVGLNLNGLETSLIFTADLNNTLSKADFARNEFKVVFDMGKIKLGSLEMSDDFSGAIYDLMSSMLSGGMAMNKVNNGYQMTFDLSSIISSSVTGTLSTILGSCNFSINTTGANKDANGTINITGSYSK